jgi:YVTN family beta-propeller protein
MSLKELARVPGGVFPDGIAYDPDDHRIFVTDEMGGALTVIDADTNAVVTRIDMGGEVGNVQYDPATKKIYAPIQSRNELAVVDPKLNRLVDHFALPGGRHPHGLRIASDGPTGYVACDNDDRLLVVDLVGKKVLATLPLGHDPDVLADDAGLKRLYVASESGMLSVFDVSTPAKPVKLGDVFAGEHAHSVAVDPGTHRLFLPLRDLNGAAVMRILEPKAD